MMKCLFSHSKHIVLVYREQQIPGKLIENYL